MRNEVREFAVLMERILQDNDHKGGWQDMTPEEVLERINEEVGELETEVFKLSIDPDRIVREAVDVANFCMMLVDNVRRESGGRIGSGL